jgi:hypothetical protein
MSSKRWNACLIVLLLVASSATCRAQESPSASPAALNELPPTDDPREIVRRALEADQSSFQLARNYTYEQRDDLKVLGKGGAVKKHEITTYDVTILYDETYSRRIRKDDRPLSDKDEKKEAEKADKFVAERKNESATEHEKRLAKQEKERQEGRAFARDVINAYDFRIVGEEQADGRDAYVVDATPRKDFHPTQPHADILPKLRGKIWISKKDYGWVRLEAETMDTISWGLVLVRIHKGTRIQLEQTLVNEEIWLPRRVSINASARFALLANGAIDLESTYSNYKKFTSGVRILPGAAEVQPASDPPR